MRTRTRPNIRAFVHERRRLLAVVGMLALALGVARLGGFVRGANPEASLGLALEREGIAVDREAVFWLTDAVGPTRFRPVVFRAAEDGGLADLYYAEARLGDAGVFSVRSVSNLTRTSSAAETVPIRVGDHLAFATRVGDSYEGVELLDLRGEAPELTADWPARARWQNRVTNLQETGRSHGFGRARFTLLEPVSELALRAEGHELVFALGTASVRIDTPSEQIREGQELVEGRPRHKAEPGTITWVVDSVRNLSFVGPEPIAWLEHRVFRAKDLLERAFYGVAGTNTEEAVAEDLGVTIEETRRRLELSVTGAVLGWPPPALEPVVRRPATGEGEWIPVIEDPFVRAYPNAPPAFLQTFLQVDEDRPFTRVYVVLWDARTVQLRVMTGTREPESATGETGRGMVPRDPTTLRRVVAGFNGGFQSLHGEFGMMSEGRVYLPPKPWAATVVVYRDGRVAMGSWLDPPEGERHYRERWAMQQIPDDMFEFRQNLTSIVEDDRINPWRRWWWGAAPQNAEEQVFIDRSGMCLTAEGHLAYFWGKSMGADELGEAMLATRCVRGIHLDMNQRHTAFEFYDVRPDEEPHPELDRRLHRSEFEMPVPGIEGWTMRGRKAVRSMTPMRFPRYMRRDPRDFFYLTLKPILPGPDVLVGDQSTSFSTDGLPHAGWPYPFARARLGADGAGVHAVRIDPARAVPGPLGREDSVEVLAWLTEGAALARGTGHALYAARASVGLRYGVGVAPEDATILLAGPPLADMPDAGAAVGVDVEGFIVYLEAEAEGASLIERLADLGIEDAIALPDTARLSFVVDGETVGLDSYERPVDATLALPFFAELRPQSEVLFPDVAPRPYMYWYRMQDTRVRYFREEGRAPRFTSPPDAGP